MAKEHYIRFLRAGRYTKVVRYSRTLPGDSNAVRQRKQAATNMAQRFINTKNSTERLHLLLCANFDSKDALFCTFTFRDDQLPANQKHTQQIFGAYLRKLRPEWQRKGVKLKYIYTVEGAPQAADAMPFPANSQRWETEPWTERERWEQLDGQGEDYTLEPSARLHVHCFLLLKKEDYEVVRALWPYGQVYISPMKVNDPATFIRLASYVTKEKRDDKKGNGARAYIPSQGLEQPEVSGHWCSEFEDIVLPKGAEEIRSGSECDEIYGTSMKYIIYRMPRAQQKPQPYTSKGTLQRKKRSAPRK